MRAFSSRFRCIVCLALLALAGPGCTRKFYRKRTDDDVVGVMTQKNQFPQWGIEQWHIYSDPRSRHYDPMNPDRPLKPPDDYAAYVLSPDPQPRKKKIGTYEGTVYLQYIEAWDALNREKKAQRPAIARAQAAFGGEYASTASDSYEKAFKSDQKTYIINLEQISDLAQFNAREFQDRREDLYGAALPVTLQRFAFVAQFTASEQAIREAAGQLGPDAPGSRWTLNTNTGFSKLFPSGATLLVKLANSLVIDLGANHKPSVSLSNFSLQLTQPFLQGGGYAVTLEPLTQAERNLLYAIRSYARFRKVYYTYVVGGNNNIFNAPYSFAGLNLRGVGPTLTAPGQGFYPTVLLDIFMRNEIQNIANLERYWKVFQAYEEGGDVSRLQVDQVEQQLLRSRSTLLQRRNDLGNGLDQFKIQLGLPTQLPLELDDGVLQPLVTHLNRFDVARDDLDNVRKEAADYVGTVRAPLLHLWGGLAAAIPLDVPLRVRLREFFLNSAPVRGTKFQQTIAARWLRWERMDDTAIKAEILKLGDEQRELLDRKARLEVENKKLPPEGEASLVRFRADINLGRFEMALRLYERKPWLKEPGPRMAREQANSYRDAISYFTLIVGEAREEQLGKIRESWPDLPPVTIDGVDLLRDELDKCQTVAAQTALTNRLELMNARGQLVDAWRQIAVSANALLGVFNVGYNLNAVSPSGANQPLNIGGSHVDHQLVLNGQLPLVRRLERNNYRTAQIAYQRQRRALQATEDFILNDVRTDLRQLRLLAENYKIQQRSIEVAYAQVENSLEALQAPPDPRSTAGGQTAGNAAALTQQLLNAQSSLLQAQNTLYTVWINYHIARQLFYRDVDLLPLDPRGVWTDEYAPTEQSSSGGTRPSQDGGIPLERALPERLPEPESNPGNAPAPRKLQLLRGAVDEPRWQRVKP